MAGRSAGAGISQMIRLPPKRPKVRASLATRYELICLRYLDDKMEVTSKMIGEALAEKLGNPFGMWTAEGRQKSAETVMANLRKRKLVTRILDINAWRITALGRSHLRIIDAP